MIGQKAATLSGRLSVWKFTVNTEAKTSGARRSAVPLHLYGQQDIEYIVDWGDSRTVSLTPSDYLEDDASASVHEYASAGRYQITIFCTDWSKARFLTFNSNMDASGETPTNCSLPRYLWQETLVSVDNPLPEIKGRCVTYTSDADSVYDGADNDFSNLFCWCDSLRSIPKGIFDANPSVVKFSSCFASCRSLAAIPKGIFDVHANAQRFDQCFYNCDSLVSIPQGLFDHNPLATHFSACFMQCEALRDVPLGLFKNNTAATQFNACFEYCLSLEHVPYDLFLYNTAATTLQWCFLDCPKLRNFKLGIGSALVSNVDKFANEISGTAKRIVCVPENSTTYYKFLDVCNGDNKIIATHVQAECLQALEYTIDTEAAEQGAKTGTIPLAASANATLLFIDWGDGTGSETAAGNVNASVLTHEYSSAGEYQITAATADWSGYSLLSDSAASSSNPLVQTFRDTLKTLDSGLPPVSNTSIDCLFYGCTHLESVTSHVLDHLDAVTSAVGCFRNCSSLESISAGTLRKQTELLDASEMFAGCSSVQGAIPSGLLSQCRKLAAADRMFKDCSGIDYIPETLFLNSEALSSRTDAFSGCTASVPTFLTKASAETAGIYVELIDTEATVDSDNKTGIPFNLTAQSVTVTAEWGDGYHTELAAANYSQTDSTSSMHQYSNPGLYFVTMESSDWSQTKPVVYISTEAVPQPVANSLAALYHRQRSLIEVCTKLPMTFYQLYAYQAGQEEAITIYVNSTAAFYANCWNLKQVPSNLLANAQSITSTNGMFSRCLSLREIPSGLFAGCSSIEYFNDMCYECRGLTSIPAGLFNPCTAAKSLYSVFKNCTSLKSIPSGLFANNAANTRFGYCFCGCTSLESIPSGLFDACVNVVEFAYTFSGCSSVTAIPAGLFSRCTACESFYSTFNGVQMTSIPAGLFGNNAGVYEFDYCFANCTELAEIPSGLFSSCIIAETFTHCFQKCTKITAIPAGLFGSCTAATSFAYCFSNCGGLLGIPSNVFANNTAVTNLASCFYFCIKIGDFDIHIGSPLVSNAASFVTKKTGASRTVNVPTGSTTYTTFDGLASTLGLTVVGE